MRDPKGILQLYLQLLEKHGPGEKYWPQWCGQKKTTRDRELIALGVILTQRTTWHNADLALRSLKKAGLLSIGKIASLKNLKRLTALIRPAGFYQTKPKRLFDFCVFVIRAGGMKKLLKKDALLLREELLNLKGFGPETTDVILLYALDKPFFVIDEYTKRLIKLRELSKELTYISLQKLFEKELPREVKVYQDFHCLIIVEQKGLPGSLMVII